MNEPIPGSRKSRRSRSKTGVCLTPRARPLDEVSDGTAKNQTGRTKAL